MLTTGLTDDGTVRFTFTSLVPMTVPPELARVTHRMIAVLVESFGSRLCGGVHVVAVSVPTTLVSIAVNEVPPSIEYEMS